MSIETYAPSAETLSTEPSPTLAIDYLLENGHVETVGMDAFAREWGVHPDFLPFASRPASPPTILKTIRELIDEKPPTAVSIRQPEIAERLGITKSSFKQHPVTTLFTSVGAWPYPDSLLAAGNMDRWINPGYKNPDDELARTDTLGQYADLATDARGRHMDETIRTKRIEWTIRGQIHGLRHRMLARRMGSSGKRAVEKINREYDIPAEAYRTAGQILLARTARTILAWDDATSTRSLAPAFGYQSGSGFRHLLCRHAPDFDPPNDPTAGGMDR